MCYSSGQQSSARHAKCTCSCFINHDFLAEVEWLAEDDQEDQGVVLCDCGTYLCPTCGTASHPDISRTVNEAFHNGDDEPFFELASEQGWKQCPRCAILIEFTHRCNHMRCTSCRHDFCYLCLTPWNTTRGLCSAGRCELWDEDRLEEAAEKRVLVRGRYIRALRLGKLIANDTTIKREKRLGEMGFAT